MALFHRATITPTKAELIAKWAPSQTWGPPTDDLIEVIGSYRFDDPDGRVGMETHLVRYGTMLLHVPLTYRDEPLDGADDALIVEMHRKPRQQVLDQCGLALAQRMALPPAVEAAGRGGVGQRAAFSASTRSSLSQLKPPSASGVRPKWP